MEDPAWHEDISATDQVEVDELLSHFSPTQIAAAFLRVYSAKQSAPEELSAVDPREAKEAKPRRVADFGPTVWFSIPGGRASGTLPGRLLPMICNAGGLTKHDIGAIKIHPDASFFEIKLSSVDGFKRALGPNLTVENDAVVTELKVPPADVPYERSSAPKSRSNKKPPVEKSSGPIDWNDAPKLKPRKPKSSEGKPKFKSKTAAQSRPDGVVESFKKKTGSGKPGAGKPSAGKSHGKPGGKLAKKATSGKPKGGTAGGRVDKHKFDPGKPKRKSS
tara:strand:- start:314 stop:1141 length:828 start_codon:yes stop_codon:yes gene_type:complete